MRDTGHKFALDAVGHDLARDVAEHRNQTQVFVAVQHRRDVYLHDALVQLDLLGQVLPGVIARVFLPLLENIAPVLRAGSVQAAQLGGGASQHLLAA